MRAFFNFRLTCSLCLVASSDVRFTKSRRFFSFSCVFNNAINQKYVFSHKLTFNETGLIVSSLSVWDWLRNFSGILRILEFPIYLSKGRQLSNCWIISVSGQGPLCKSAFQKCIKLPYVIFNDMQCITFAYPFFFHCKKYVTLNNRT